MGNSKKYIAVSIVAMIIVYLSGAFIATDFDIRTWGVLGRLTAILVVLFAVYFTVMIDAMNGAK